MNTFSTLTLVGAGPGDPDLITIKGIKALRMADVVLYDALIDRALLNYSKPTCIKKYVGKRAGKHSMTQDQICELIIKLGAQYKNIVRLKGGDPFVFGRAVEEIKAARAAAMNVEIVPGLSSAVAVATSAMIPVTSRGTSQSFWVATGTTSDGKLSKDIYLAAQSSATIVLLMAIKHLREIMAVFLNFKRQETPVAVIQEGCTKNQKMVTGNVQNICLLVQHARLKNPAIAIIGEAVRSQKALTEVIQIGQPFNTTE